MPPRRRPQLGPQELAALAEAVAAGRRRTVYLRAALPSLGLDAGTSARVVSVEGATVTVRPRGVGDDVPFDAAELAPTAAAALAPVDKPVDEPRVPAPVARRRAPVAVQVTLAGTADGGWSVQVAGVRYPVAAEDVARAVAALGEPHAGRAVDAVLAHARAEAARRVDELTVSLADARATLEALAVDSPRQR